MAFGLCNAPATYSNLVKKVLQDIPAEIVLAFLDDTLILGKTLDNHLQNIERVLKKFKKAGLTLQPSKCKILQTEIDFLGHHINANKIKLMDNHLDLIRRWPEPKSIRGIRSFLGKTSYYRMFIRGYSQISAPLSDLTRTEDTKKPFQMTKAASRAFLKLKESLMSPPILAHPDFEGSPFILDTDWSDRAIGGVLSQVQNGKECVLQYGTPKLLPA